MDSTHSISQKPLDLTQYKRSVPCQVACPIRTDVPGYIEALIREDYREAYRINRMDNVLPSVLGRVCHRPCEPACRHARHGDAVRICHLKRSAADFGLEPMSVSIQPNGKSVAIIGSGPAGLTAANDLALRGYHVVVFEQWDQLGGMLRYAIPEFRLPRDAVEKDIQSIAALGVEFRTGTRIESREQLEDLQHHHDAVLFAAGCMLPTRMELPGMGSRGSYWGLDFVLASARGELTATPRKAVIIGGGFTAVDCARICFRLGAEEVTLAYRRTQAQLRVGPLEVEALAAEGVATKFLTSPVAIREDHGAVSALRLVRNTLDSSGLARAVDGSEYELEADTVILAIGQSQEDSVLSPKAAPAPGNLFLAGDFRRGSGTVVEACADGRDAARRLHESLLGVTFTQAVEIQPVELSAMPRDRAGDARPAEPMPALPRERRRPGLDEVETGYDPARTRAEASRCYLCNYQFHIDPRQCIYCLKCIEAMPVDCIHLTRDQRTLPDGNLFYERASSLSGKQPGIVIDQSACIRCGECVRVCPVDCISITRRRWIETSVTPQAK